MRKIKGGGAHIGSKNGNQIGTVSRKITKRAVLREIERERAKASPITLEEFASVFCK